MMMALERWLIELLLNFVARDEINIFLRSPQNTATIIGCLIAVSGALLGTFLLLRGMALTSDAISHTVLLGIVVAFLLMTDVFGMAGDTSSPWLILGASLAGVGTVVLTELLYRSGLVRQDAALGLAFPLLLPLPSYWFRALPTTCISTRMPFLSEKSASPGQTPTATASTIASLSLSTGIIPWQKRRANAATAANWASVRATTARSLSKSVPIALAIHLPKHGRPVTCKRNLCWFSSPSQSPSRLS